MKKWIAGPTWALLLVAIGCGGGPKIDGTWHRGSGVDQETMIFKGNSVEDHFLSTAPVTNPKKPKDPPRMAAMPFVLSGTYELKGEEINLHFDKIRLDDPEGKAPDDLIKKVNSPKSQAQAHQDFKGTAKVEGTKLTLSITGKGTQTFDKS